MSHESARLFYPLSCTKEEPCSFYNTYGSYIITYPNWDTFVQGNAKLEKKKILELQAYAWTVPKISGYKVPFCGYIKHPQHLLSLDLFLFYQSPALVSHGFTVLKKKEINKSPSYHLLLAHSICICLSKFVFSLTLFHYASFLLLGPFRGWANWWKTEIGQESILPLIIKFFHNLATFTSTIPSTLVWSLLLLPWMTAIGSYFYLCPPWVHSTHSSQNTPFKISLKLYV